MATTTITYRGSRDSLNRLLASLPALMAGRLPDPGGIVAAGLQLRVGMTALMLIKTAYVVKARGGTDEAGEKWAPLAPSTIARRRLGAKDRKLVTDRARLAGLSKEQQKAYREALRGRRGELLARGIDAGRAEGLARAHAAKAVGGGVPSKEKILAGRSVEILRDTGRLLTSLSPGLATVPRHGLLTAPPHNDDSLLRVVPGRIVIGSNVRYGTFHHHGGPRLPQRRLWPKVATWPRSWWRQLNESFATGTARVIEAYGQRYGGTA